MTEPVAPASTIVRQLASFAAVTSSGSGEIMGKH